MWSALSASAKGRQMADENGVPTCELGVDSDVELAVGKPANLGHDQRELEELRDRARV